jgi:cytochrome c biogenesis protein CcmG/thiol:disulfide interchange protein DsbE
MLTSRWITKCLTILCLSTLGSLAFSQELSVGDEAPLLEADEWINVDGPVDFVNDEGRYTVVEFWATWCPPCRTTIPHLNAMYERFADEVAFISLTDEGREQADIDGFMDYFEMIYPVATGSNSWSDYGVTGIPHAFVVDADGIIVWTGHPLDGLEEVIEAYID